MRPPQGPFYPPTFAPLKGAAPGTLEDGSPFSPKTPAPALLEKLGPPDGEEGFPEWKKEKALASHWHAGALARYYHVPGAWGVWREGAWAWMIQSRKRWWSVADGAQRVLWHGERWWWRTPEGWFMLHEGRPWAWRLFSDLKRQGFWDPSSGARVVYSEDALRAAVLEPGGRWAVYDARSGVLLEEGGGEEEKKKE